MLKTCFEINSNGVERIWKKKNTSEKNVKLVDVLSSYFVKGNGYLESGQKLLNVP